MTGPALLALILGAFLSLISPASARMFKYYHVYVINDLPLHTPNLIKHTTNLVMHCWSSEDDVGSKSLGPKDTYFFQFQINFAKRTRFECEGGWGNQRTRFTGFKAYRDEGRCAKYYNCFWSVRQDGFYFSNDNSTWDLEYKWPPSQ